MGPSLSEPSSQGRWGPGKKSKLDLSYPQLLFSHRGATVYTAVSSGKPVPVQPQAHLTSCQTASEFTLVEGVVRRTKRVEMGQ